ncbi:MAG: class A beta-lactamase-related serine hydrolase [Gammaproteobacteria bacterium]|nr:class A beta-lactamase-related serine hydrolase [Gammaproteobacteria bacterium]
MFGHKSTWLSITALLLAVGFTQSVLAQSMTTATPESVGVASSGLQAATAKLQQHIDDGDIAGVVAAVARDGKLIYFEALGQMDLEQGKPMPKDALFRLYSMSRQITSIAVLQLYDQDKFQFDDPIKKYLPQFADQRVLLNPNSTDVMQTQARVGDITVAQLLTHTSGLGSRSSRLYVENKVRDRNITLDEMVDNAARVPLFHQPGSAFLYGIHATILGKLVEVWSGQPFEEYLQQHLFAPLVMNSTMFWATGSDAERLAVVYRPTEGRLTPYEIETVPFTAKPKLIEGGVGMLSSVMDYLHFAQMVMNKGEFNGTRVLSEATAELMYLNGVPEQAMPIGDNGYWLGSGWTLGGFNLVMDPAVYNFPVSEGTIWWDGSAGTRFFIDPSQNLITVIMAQVSPADGAGFREEFSAMVDAALLERR